MKLPSPCSGLLSWSGQSSFSRLMAYLWEPDYQTATAQAWVWSIAAIPALQVGDQTIHQQARQEIIGLPVNFTERLPQQWAGAGHSVWQENDSEEKLLLTLVAGAASLSVGDFTQAGVVLNFAVKETAGSQALKQWQRLWHLVNVLQFLPNFYAYTPESKHDGIAAGMEWPELTVNTRVVAKGGVLTKEGVLPNEIISAKEPGEPLSKPKWLELLEPDLAEALLPFIDRFVKGAEDDDVEKDIESAGNEPVPVVVGFELEDSQGEIIAEGELAVPARKLVYLTEEQVDAKQAFEDLGWQTFTYFEAFLDGLGFTAERAN